jgi:DNA modification methylase
MPNKQLYLFPNTKQKNDLPHHANKVIASDLPVHDWCRFVLSFPPHLVRQYVEKFSLKKGNTLLDPFCGTGTTLVEAKLLGLKGIGVEANQMAYFASGVKCRWEIELSRFFDDAKQIEKKAANTIRISKSFFTLTDEENGILLNDSIAEIPLHRTLILRDAIRRQLSEYEDHFLLALAMSTVRYCSRLRFGPEVGVSYKKKTDDDVLACWLKTINVMVADLKILQPQRKSFSEVTVIHGDARIMSDSIQGQSIDAVFTSPPYPNEKDYTRTTRLESVLLGFIKNKDDLRRLKENLLRSNTRNIYKDDCDDDYILHHPEILQIAETIENKRIRMGKTSGFEKQYHKVVRQYFGGMARHLAGLKPLLKKNAMLGYVVGDQASFLQVHIPTAKILADIADSIGYKVVAIDLFRTRFATATRKAMNEEVLVLQWKGE